VVATGRTTLLSFSPELFFSLEGRRLACRPMKGTARRGATPAADAAAARALAADPKQRAENLMIVDLMRNDLSRVAAPGSVATPELFAVETYPTIHQMVSVVTAELAPGLDAVDVLAAAFPCGSITGAPKVRAQAALAAIETGPPRGSYTGSIGRIDTGGDAAFNVAIRTLMIEGGTVEGGAIEGDGPPALIGLGSGLVADSELGAEWDECLAKAAFLRAGHRRFDLIETMAFDSEEGIVLLERHIERMRRSAELFGFAFDRHSARNELQAATFRLRGAARIRLLLAAGGAVSVETGPMPPAPPAPVPVAVAPLPVDGRDFRLRHKTTDRGFYDRARRDAGEFEVLFEDGDGYLTEGSFTSLFVPRGDHLLTPPLARGLLPGVLRGALIADGRAVEGDVTAADLVGGFFIGNALRGLMPAVAVGSGASL
jgi:para-aminobenzoate synthetase/4-amino-4-deoxychorismate lyase